MHLEKINSAVVKPIPLPKEDKREWKGAEVMTGYPNVFICCRKNSGKTTMIHDMLKRTCCKRQTKVFAIVASHDKDANWIAIMHMLQEKGIPNEFYFSIHDPVDGKNALDKIIEEIDTPPESSEDEEEEPQIIRDDTSLTVKRKPRKPKKLAPRFVIVLDDVSSELKDKRIAMLYKRNRHSKCRTITSSQYIHDLVPAARTQIDIFLLGHSICREKLLHVYKFAEPPMSEEEFFEMYHFATTSGQYKFLYLNPTKQDYRVNFDKRIHV